MATTAARQKQSPSTMPAALAAAVAQSPDATTVKHAGYGLPCANCHLYYPADLPTCPICQHRERVSPVVKKAALKRTEPAPGPMPDSASLEQEREEFLRQFKSQLVHAHADVAHRNGSLCALSQHHDGEEASAEICKTCYEHLYEKIDSYEAALEMDVKQAAKVIYDAVWADPSDPSKTYENAATALLTELRKRAGITAAHNPFEPLTD